MGHNEMLISEALAGRNREDVQISVKFGALRDRLHLVGPRCAPAAVKSSCLLAEAAGVDYIDIYRPSRLDPSVPIEDTVGPSPTW